MSTSVTKSVLALGLAALLTGCSSSSDPAKDTANADSSSSSSAERTVEGCDGRTVTFTDVPERIVALDATSAAFLIELGVGDNIVGISGTDYIQDYEGDLKAQLEDLEVLDQGFATQEVVLAAEPDLVVSMTSFAFGKFDGTASVETLEQNDIAALWACETVSSGVSTNLDVTDNYVTQLATATNQSDAGEKVLEDYTSAIEEATASLDGKQVPTLLYTSAAQQGGGIVTRGGATFANALLSVSGALSISSGLEGNIVQISAEEVVAQDPQLIVATYGMGAMGPATAEEVRASILANPQLATTSAVKNDRIVVLPSRILLAPSLTNPDAAQQIAEAVTSIG